MTPRPWLAAVLCLSAVSARALDCSTVKPDAKDFSLDELSCLKTGPAAGDAASMFQALSSVAWPPGLTKSLTRAGLRVRFAAPNARAAVEQSGIYDWTDKTIYLWDRPRAAVVVHELGHALDDLLLPDELGSSPCRVMTSNTDEEFTEIWKAYIRRVNAHMGLEINDDGGRLLPISESSARMFLRDFSGSATGWFTELPLFDDPKNPITGPRGYVSVQEYWAETVQRRVTSSAWLKARDAKAFDYIERKLAQAEKGALETVKLPVDAGRCKNLR
ncbi:MAG: hypothetical protein COV48_07575 [Elusimicrobia bacterium CG11_big_fil_rev_8_21_14_0_20_64_6]|nr:MAG: hypothetical protein COV48_07575 [Elusimicrobia bacterium CG11_big_fil_rev_8_21_14_0_20_64_6]